MSILWKPLLLVGLTLAACAPNPASPVSVMVVGRLGNGTYGPEPVVFNTIKDLTAMNGVAATMIGGSRIIYDSSDPLLAGGIPTDAQLKDIILKQKGGNVRVDLVQRNGIYWPVDFQSWNIASTYYNFELAYQYFNSVGVLDPTEISDSQVYYFPDFINTANSPSLEYDDAIWYSPVAGFLILPFKELQRVPIPMNRGAVAHEFSHRIFNGRVYHGQNLPLAERQFAGTTLLPAFKVLKSYDEGLADFHAVESLCTDGTSQAECNDTLFLEPTIGAEAAAQRDVSVGNNCLTTSLINGITAQDTSDNFINLGHEYFVGTVIASSLYLAGEATQQQLPLQAAVIASYSDNDPVNFGFQQLVDNNLGSLSSADVTGMNLGSFANIIANHISDANLKDQVCGQFLDRLRPTAGSTGLIPACSNSSPAGVCPALQ